MKKKTAILLVGALALTAVLSGCGKNKEATEAANESVESEDPEGKAKKDFYGRTECPFTLVNNKVITPSEDEQAQNPRSRSAKLRIAEKIGSKLTS